MSLPIPQAILFDLDGTLADTAPDLAQAANKLRITRGLAPVAYELLRPVASAGARGLIGAAFGIGPDDEGYTALRDEFLQNYQAAIAVDSRLFDGVADLLTQLESAGIAWGIVTNKAEQLTSLLVPLIGLGHARCMISGDTTAFPKPHAAPLLEACRRIGIPASDCWYVGDDLRDMQAGHAAGMTTVAAAWGYCGDTAPVTWQANAIAVSPSDVLQLVRNAGRKIAGS
ncbi:MAG TPA: HAD-IA family hydrolase [Oxalicibacterium sp.]|nr:HAD-IA family hydrolase [Oxalicibacterium sp.]